MLAVHSTVVVADLKFKKMKKLFLVLICAVVSFAFADSSAIDGSNGPTGPCDGYGGIVTFTLAIDCGGDGIYDFVGEIKTCRDQREALEFAYYEGYCSE